MRASALAVCAALVTMAGAACAQANPVPVAEVSFHFERPGLPVPRYTITVHEDATTIYDGEQLADYHAPTTVNAPAVPGVPFHQAVSLTPATTRRIFELAESVKEFHVACESKAKNIANTGQKTLAYRGPRGEGSCTYNYSENKAIVQLTDVFLAITETLNEGRELEHLRRYDRLGLDASLDRLAQEVTDGRAMDLSAIAPDLRSIAGDPDLMQRVRMRASKLLSLLPADQQKTQP